MSLSPPEFARWDPFRPPHWRWARAQVVGAPGHRPARDDDGWVHLAADFVRYLRWAGCHDGEGQACEVPRRLSAVAAAHRIHEAGGITRDELQARILAGEDTEAIARKARISTEVVAAFAGVFYSLGEDRRAFDRIVEHGLAMHTWPSSGPGRAESWKYAALAGGPVLLDMVIEAELHQTVGDDSEPQRLVSQARQMAMDAWADRFADRATYVRVARESLVVFRESLDRLVKQDPKLEVMIRILRLSLRRQRPPKPETKVALPGARRAGRRKAGEAKVTSRRGGAPEARIGGRDALADTSAPAEVIADRLRDALAAAVC